MNTSGDAEEGWRAGRLSSASRIDAKRNRPALNPTQQNFNAQFFQA